jgi:hypothetical protein
MQEFQGLFGYISIVEAEKRQVVPGNIETRMPGIFWCNYFSKTYVEFFGKEKFINGPWLKSEFFPNGRILTFLTDMPNEELLVDKGYEKIAKAFLGEESFGDMEYYRKHLRGVQVKRVPKLDLNELKIDLNSCNVKT